MTTDPTAAAREKLVPILKEYRLNYYKSDLEFADAILSAGFVLTAPTQDAVALARKIVNDYWFSSDKPDLASMIAATITAAEARVREECAKIADDFVARAKKSREHYRGSEDGSEESCLRDQLAGMEIAIAIRAGGGR